MDPVHVVACGACEIERALALPVGLIQRPRVAGSGNSDCRFELLADQFGPTQVVRKQYDDEALFDFPYLSDLPTSDGVDGFLAYHCDRESVGGGQRIKIVSHPGFLRILAASLPPFLLLSVFVWFVFSPRWIARRKLAKLAADSPERKVLAACWSVIHESPTLTKTDSTVESARMPTEKSLTDPLTKARELSLCVARYIRLQKSSTAQQKDPNLEAVERQLSLLLERLDPIRRKLRLRALIGIFAAQAAALVLLAIVLAARVDLVPSAQLSRGAWIGAAIALLGFVPNMFGVLLER